MQLSYQFLGTPDGSWQVILVDMTSGAVLVNLKTVQYASALAIFQALRQAFP